MSWPALIALGGSLVVRRADGGDALRCAARPTSCWPRASSAASLLFGAVMAPFGWVTPSVRDLGLFALAGCISVGALLCVNRSLKLAPASVVVPYQYTMIIWAVMFGYVVFGDVPSAAMLAGAAVIIVAGLYIFLREQSLVREEPVVVPPPG